RQADAGPAGGPRIAVCHEGGGLLVAGQDVPDRRLAVQGVVKRSELSARITEDVPHAQVAQPADEDVGARHGIASRRYLPGPRVCSKTKTPFLLATTMSGSPSPLMSPTQNCVPMPVSVSISRGPKRV